MISVILPNPSRAILNHYSFQLSFAITDQNPGLKAIIGKEFPCSTTRADSRNYHTRVSDCKPWQSWQSRQPLARSSTLPSGRNSPTFCCQSSLRILPTSPPWKHGVCRRNTRHICTVLPNKRLTVHIQSIPNHFEGLPSSSPYAG